MDNISRNTLSSKIKINQAIHAFTYGQMLLFLALIAVFLVSGFLILDRINEKYLIERPLAGGSVSEGVIGSPRFINPVLATTSTDKDLVAIIFSGLMKKGISGEMENDLAESYTISEDKYTYTFTIKENAVFHDNTKITADDVLFTISQIKNGSLKSPHQSSWQSVSVTKIDERTVEFKLSSPYTSFLENTSIGILPAHLWKDLDTEDFTFSENNLNAIGSGPYEISHIEKNKKGLIESISLSSFGHYVGQKAYINKVKFVFYRNEEDLIKAFKKNKIDQINAISGNQARVLSSSGEMVTNVNLTRIFGLFFNSNKQEIFRNKEVVKAINLAIDKQKIIDLVIGGYGQSIDSPIPKTMYAGEDESPIEPSIESKIEEANSILDKQGFAIGENNLRKKDGKVLSFSISTGDAPELQQVANMIKEDLSKIGINVDVKIFEIGNLNQSVIRPRDYESLFFGQIITNESDLFAFWHSSQRNDPGLNIASYTNSKVDGLLERMLASKDEEEKNGYFKDIESEIQKDLPAIFIYSPDFIYLMDKKVQNININNINLPSERLSHINTWYIRTEKVWNFLNK